MVDPYNWKLCHKKGGSFIKLFAKVILKLKKIKLSKMT